MAMLRRARLRSPRLTTAELELLTARYFGTRTNVIVPNVSWGLLNHEADLLVCRPSMWMEEIELKVSRSDLCRDLQKDRGRGHMRDRRVCKLWFAVPAELADDPAIPSDAGILKAVAGPRFQWHMETVRAPVKNKNAEKLTQAEFTQLLRLSTLRVWSLKEKLAKYRADALKENA